MAAADLLEVIVAHFAIKAIALHALETPVGEILTGVVVFARIFTRRSGQPQRDRLYDSSQKIKMRGEEHVEQRKNTRIVLGVARVEKGMSPSSPRHPSRC